MLKRLLKSTLAAAALFTATPAFADPLDLLFRECPNGEWRILGLPCPSTGGAQGVMDVTSVGDDGLESYFREDKPSATMDASPVWDGTSITVETPRNAFAFFTIITETSETTPQTFTVTVSALDGPGADSITNTSTVFSEHQNRPISVYKPVYVPTRGISWFASDVANYDDRHVFGQWRSTDGSRNASTRPALGKSHVDGLLDVTLPNANNIMSVSAVQSHTTWVRVWVDDSIAAGDYVGSVTITDGDGDTQVIPLTIKAATDVLDDENENIYVTFVNAPHVADRFTGIKFINPTTQSTEYAHWQDALDSAGRLLRSARMSPVYPSSNGGPVPASGSRFEARVLGSIYSGTSYIGPGRGTTPDVDMMGVYADWKFWNNVNGLDLDSLPAAPTPTALADHFTAYDTWKAANLPNAKTISYMTDEAPNLTVLAQSNKEAGWFGAYNPLVTTGSTLDPPNGLNFENVFDNCSNCDTVLVNAPIMPTDTPTVVAAWRGTDANNTFGLYNGQSPMHYSYMLDDRSSGLIINGLGQALLNLVDGETFGMDFYWSATNFINDEGYGDITGAPAGTQILGSDNRARGNFFTTGNHFGADDADIARRTTHGHAGFLYTEGDGYLVIPGNDAHFPANNMGVNEVLPTVRLFQITRRNQITQLAYQKHAINSASTTALLSNLFSGHRFGYQLGVTNDGLGNEERSFLSSPRELDDILDSEIINLKRGLLDVTAPVVVSGDVAQCRDGIDNDGDGQIDMADGQCNYDSDNIEAALAAAPQSCPAVDGLFSPVDSDISSSVAGSIFNSASRGTSSVATSTNNTNNPIYKDGFLDVSWADGLQDGGVTYVVDPTGAQVSTGIQYVIDKAADAGLGVYVPDGTYLLDRTLIVRSWGTKRVSTDCSKGNTFKAPSLYGESTNGTVFKLADSPAFDFDTPSAPRPFMIYVRDRGENCTDYGTEAQALYLNGGRIAQFSANGFSAILSTFTVDINGHAGAIGLVLRAAQNTFAENIHVTSSTGTRVGTAYGQLAVRTSGGKNLSADNVDLMFKWSGDEVASNPGVRGFTARNINALVQTSDRTLAWLTGGYVEHNTANGSLVREQDGGFGGAAGALELTDVVIHVTDGAPDTPLFKWDQYRKSFGLRDVAIYGKQSGKPIAHMFNGANDVASVTSGWQRIGELYQAQDMAQSTFNTSNHRYTAYPGVNIIDGVRTERGFHKSDHVALVAAPVNLWEKHWDTVNMHPFAPHMLSLINDFCIPADGSRVTGNEIQAVIDAGHEYLWFGRGTWMLDPGQTLTLGAHTKIAGLNAYTARLVSNPDTTSSGGTPKFTVSTVADADGTGRIRGFSIYGRGRGSDAEATLRDLSPTKVFPKLEWKLGANSSVEQIRGRRYDAVSTNTQSYSPLNDIHVVGPTGGGAFSSIVLIESAGSGIQFGVPGPGQDYRAFVAENTVEPISHYGVNDEHKKNGPHRAIVDSANYQSFGNKNECNSEMIWITRSSNVSVSGDGIGCEQNDSVKVEDSSAGIRLSTLMPHDWDEDTTKDQVTKYVSGVRSVLATHGEGIGLYLEGNFDGDVFRHGHDCDTSSQWGTGVLIRPELSCPSLVDLDT